MALTQKGDNINWSLIFERPKTVEEKEGQEKGEKKRKRKRKRREEKERKIKGMETNLEYGFMELGMKLYGF